MSKQRRFESELEIRLEIARERQRAKRYTKRGLELDGEAAASIHKSRAEGIKPGEREWLIGYSIEVRKKAQKQYRTAELIESNKIPQLVRTLAAFQTKPMPFLNDNAVVMEK